MEQIQNRHFNVLIVGQGLAGSLLAWQMIRHGLNVLVIDNNHQQSSSKVAAGIINPITGHRSNLTDGFVKFMSYAKTRYEELEDTLGQTFLIKTQQQRLLKNQGQQHYYLKRLEQTNYADFVSTLEKTDNSAHPFKSSEFGVADIQETFRVDVKALLSAIKSWLISQNSYIDAKIDYADINFTNTLARINNGAFDYTAEQLVFCEGYQAIYNPWLHNLPFKLAKGEILTVQLDKPQTAMLNWGHWLLPLLPDNDIALLGSNYAWNDTSESCNVDVAQELIDSLEKYTSISARISNHQSGIRPSTINRKPLISVHPEQPNLYCFNGFGSKGCLLIPYYAEQFAQHFSKGMALDSLIPELDT